MSLRNEQCNKVCRILDDVLANRPTERDSLITAVRKAFGALETEPRWIPCSERLPEVPCLVSDANNNFPYVPAGIITLEDKEHGKWAIDGKWFERMMLDGKEADMLIYSNRIVAWIPLPEPYKEEGEKDGKDT